MKKFLIFLLALSLFFELNSALALGVSDILGKAKGAVSSGGFAIVVVPCTCPVPTGAVWIEFTPMFIGSVPVGTGALVYQPGISKAYSHGNAGIPSAWYLGEFNPTPDLTCNTGVPPYCLPLPNYGTIKFTGTGLP